MFKFLSRRPEDRIGPIRPVIGPLSPVTIYIYIYNHNCIYNHTHIPSRISISIHISIYSPSRSGRGIQGGGGVSAVQGFVCAAFRNPHVFPSKSCNPIYIML